MDKGRFSEILKEYGFSDRQIDLLWNRRPAGNLDEKRLRETAEAIAPVKDHMVQA